MSNLSLFPSSTFYNVLHPITKEETGFILELVSTDHDDVFQAQFKGAKAATAKGITNTNEIALSLEFTIPLYAACIVGWTNTNEDFKAVFEKLGFSDDSYSPEKALSLLSQKNVSWLRKQIDSVVADQQRFFEKASTV